MLAPIKALLNTQSLEDQDQKRIARLLHLMSMTLLAASTLSLVAALWSGQFKAARVLCLGIAVPLAALWLKRQGRLKAASRLLLFLFLATLNYLLYQGGGSHDTVIAVYPVTLVMAALLLNTRDFALFVLLAILSTQALIYGELSGFIVNNLSTFTEPVDLIYFFVILLITAISAKLLSASITHSIFKTRAARRALEKSNHELQREIAERKRTELSLLRQTKLVCQILDTVPEGVILLEKDGQVAYANPLGERDLVSLSNAQVGDTPTHVGSLSIQELLVSSPTSLWRQVVVENRTFQIISCPIDNVQIGPQSSEVDQRDTVKDDESGWVMVIRDVTREYKVAQRLQHQQRLAAIEQLAGGIAHGFNNILTAIKGYTEFALDRLDPDTLCYGDL